jgi:hypothetical protein
MAGYLLTSLFDARPGSQSTRPLLVTGQDMWICKGVRS